MQTTKHIQGSNKTNLTLSLHKNYIGTTNAHKCFVTSSHIGIFYNRNNKNNEDSDKMTSGGKEEVKGLMASLVNVGERNIWPPQWRFDRWNMTNKE